MRVETFTVESACNVEDPICVAWQFGVEDFQ